ncbi:hypothetical protein AVEN_264218-1 [Araneus ventricosus]|uniref:Uncharacterized protein n=1 Tax=Araneus ventricosus TaxID=182803 RepID=A0A4Y2EET2_ARAVE|nr:hypothetical protein AVEN_264218-1 [Araneus ventricosus]
MKLEIPRVGEEESGWQEFCDFEFCVQTNFGTFVNALSNFSAKMGGKTTSLRINGIPSLQVNAQLKAGGWRWYIYYVTVTSDELTPFILIRYTSNEVNQFNFEI